MTAKNDGFRPGVEALLTATATSVNGLESAATAFVVTPAPCRPGQPRLLEIELRPSVEYAEELVLTVCWFAKIFIDTLCP